MNSMETNPEILDARKKLAEKFVSLKIGGKGTQRRKDVPKHKSTAVQDKKIQSLAKKSQARKLNDVQEVNIFKDDNTVLHFKKPSFEYSPKEKASFLTGPFEQKHIKDLLPNILKQLGPKQYSFMKDYVDQLKSKDTKTEGKIDEAPELVEDFEEVSNAKN